MPDMSQELRRQYGTIPSPWADYAVYSFPDASRVSHGEQQSLMDAMNNIIAVNWKATEPHWTAASSPFDRKFSLILVYASSGLVAFSVYRRLRISGSPALYRSGTEVLPAHQGRGLYGFFTSEVLRSSGAADSADAGILYGWRTRNPIVWAATAYAIAFLQRVSPQSVSLSFMADFGTDAAGVAMLASSYFWGYTLMQIPAGVLVDRYGVKRVVLFSMAASSLGSAAFALAPNLLDVFAARLIVACGDALVFTALLKLVAQSFADERFGVMSGISQVSGYVGGVIATTPLAAAVTGFGWRACFLFIAGIGLANLAFAKVTLKTDPELESNKTLKGVVAAARQSLSHIANWGCAMTFASHFAVVTTLSGVWGIPMVGHVFNIWPTAAGTPLLGFMIGHSIGSIFLC